MIHGEEFTSLHSPTETTDRWLQFDAHAGALLGIGVLTLLESSIGDSGPLDASPDHISAFFWLLAVFFFAAARVIRRAGVMGGLPFLTDRGYTSEGGSMKKVSIDAAARTLEAA